MPKAIEPVRLRTVSDLIAANEDLFNKQRSGQIDAKTLDGCNTVIKSQQYLLGKLRLDAMKLFLTARIKKIDLPQGLLPSGLEMPSNAE